VRIFLAQWIFADETLQPAG